VAEKPQTPRPGLKKLYLFDARIMRFIELKNKPPPASPLVWMATSLDDFTQRGLKDPQTKKMKPLIHSKNPFDPIE